LFLVSFPRKPYMIAPKYGSHEKKWVDASLAVTVFTCARKGW